MRPVHYQATFTFECGLAVLCDSTARVIGSEFTVLDDSTDEADSVENGSGIGSVTVAVQPT